MTRRIRVDRLLVERGLFESRAKAQAAIAAGRVSADELRVQRPSEEISADAVLRAEPAHPYVSRGGLKLAAALDHFRSNPVFDPRGRVCLDVGASTGGFTELLLARGARRIYAVDVGRGQLHRSLRARAEIVSIEATDIRLLDPKRLAEQPDFLVIDVSFISLKLVLPAALALARTPPSSPSRQGRHREPRPHYANLPAFRGLRRLRAPTSGDCALSRLETRSGRRGPSASRTQRAR